MHAFIMKKSENDRVRLNNKIFPVFYGLSADLIFFIAISTLFFTEVKGLTSAEINFIVMLGSSVALPFYLFGQKIIKKIGNVFSLRLGLFLMLIASLLFTFSNHIVFLAIGEILYGLSAVFRCVDSVILNNNLNYENKQDRFLKIKSQATTIYSIATLIAALLSGLLFTINPYIPMIICALICLNNFVLSFLIYEAKANDKEKSVCINRKQARVRFRPGKIALLAIVVYGLLYGTIAVCQTNDKLFMQYRLNDFLNIETVAVVLSLIIFLSRVSRLVSNVLMVKYSEKYKTKIVYAINFGLIISIAFFIIGRLIPSALVGSILMAIGFVLLLALRDPAENVFSTILLQNVEKTDEEKAILYFQFARRAVVLLLSLLASVVLIKYELVHLYAILAVFTVLYLFVTVKLVTLVKNNDKKYMAKHRMSKKSTL